MDLPWVPAGPVGSRRLINDIVLVEESDERNDSFISHFELYLEGMTQADADTSVINAFISRLRARQPVLEAAECAETIKLALAARARLWDGIFAAIGDRVAA